MKKRFVCICLTLCLGLAAYAQMTASAAGTNMSSVTSDSIKAKEEQIKQAQKEKEALENKLSDLKEIKKDLETKKSNLKEYVVQLDNTLMEMEQNINDLKQQISAKEEEIRLTEQELEAALEREENQKESMVARIRFVYETGNPKLMELLIKSSGLNDFLNKADYVEKVMAYDRKMLQDYKEMREYIELCMEELELEKQILDQAKYNVELEQQNLENLIDQKTRDIISYETDIQNKENAIKEYEDSIKAQDAEIGAMEAAIAEEKKKIIASNGTVLTYDNGPFKFPLASYTAVSDEYGMRIDPILGVEQFHNGVDFASPKGTAIYAAYDGIVVAATYSSSMGNYVMIDHGDELYTIYMHASALYVKKDDIVARGETIAAVGSTGRSTGNHLHFSVRLNGAYTSPWNYLSE